MVRNLRRAEALVTQAVLSGHPTEGSGRGMPRRTRQTVQRRLEGWGWFRNRWVPSLPLFGHTHLHFDLTRPFADERHAEIDRLRALPETLVLWAGTDTLFSVRAAGPSDGATRRSRAAEPRPAGGSGSLAADPALGQIPVYFDFEGAWVRQWALGASRSYPQGYPASPKSGEGSDAAAPTAAESRTVRAMLARDSAPRDATAGDAGLSAMEAKCLDKGWVSRRSFLAPTAVARTVDGFPSQAVFLRGTLRSGAEPDRPLRELLGECGVSPFLFATDGHEVLMAALALGPGAPILRGSAVRSPVLPTLQKSIRGIAVSREPLASLEVWVDHDYTRCADPDVAKVPAALPPARAPWSVERPRGAQTGPRSA